MKKLNLKQKENLAVFYNNLALAIITFGVISPIFTGINNYVIFFLQGIFSIFFHFAIVKNLNDFFKMNENYLTAYWLIMIFLLLFSLGSFYWFSKRK